MNMYKKKGIKCRNCRHVVWYDDVEEKWHHKSMLHDDNCECRIPEPRWKEIQKKLKEIMDSVDLKNIPYDRSRGWNSLTVDEMFRPFTI